MNHIFPHPFDAEDDDYLFEDTAVASMTECTGLIPAAPLSEPEVDFYSEIYDIPLAKDKKRAKNGLQKADT